MEISGSADAPELAEARLVVSTTAQQTPYRREVVHRLARGVVGYRELKNARGGAAASSRRERNLICLENAHVKATFYPSNGVCHELCHRATGTDCLGEGDYPFGAVWYGGVSASFQKFERKPGSVAALFAGTRQGHRFTMTATLAEQSSFVQIVWGGGSAPPVPKPYYIMSRLSLAGTHDALVAPLRRGPLRMEWKGRRSREVELEGLALPMFAVENAKEREVFIVAFKDLPFDSVLLRTRQAAHNYMIFKPNGQAPGRFTFWLGVVPGSMDEAQEAVRGLLQ